MRTINSLVAVRNFSIEKSVKGSVYYKVEIQQYASKEEGSTTWTNTLLSSKGKEVTLVRISESMYKLWFKDKLINGNILMLSLEEHIVGVTEYMVKDEVKVHGSELIAEGKAVIGDITYDCIGVQQTMSLDLVRINGKNHLAGELDDLLPYMIQGIQHANDISLKQSQTIISNRSSFDNAF